MLVAAVAPLVVPASVLGKGGAVAPSDRITMGFIGVGGQGRRHLLGGIAETLGRTLKWDPKAEKFIGDDEANRLRQLARRAPWRI